MNKSKLYDIHFCKMLFLFVYNCFIFRLLTTEAVLIFSYALQQIKILYPLHVISTCHDLSSNFYLLIFILSLNPQIVFEIMSLLQKLTFLVSSYLINWPRSLGRKQLTTYLTMLKISSFGYGGENLNFMNIIKLSHGNVN